MSKVDHIERATLAGLFIGCLFHDMGAEDFNEFCRLTRESFQESTCHSHDFVDANMSMDAAFNKLKGRSPEADSQEDMDLFNEAWTHAKRFVAGKL